MALDIKPVEYYHLTVEGQVGEGGKLLSVFAGVGVNLLAFKAVSLDSRHTRFTFVPDDSSKMNAGAKQAGLHLEGPHAALFIRGDDDEPGACANIHERLSQADIPISESTGLANINGSYGVLLYIKSEDCERAVAALKG